MSNETWKKIGLGCGGCLGLTVLGFVGMITLGVIVSDDTVDEAALSSTPETTQEADTSTQEDDEEDLEVGADRILELLLASQWHELTTQEQNEVCQSWILAPDAMVEAFMEGWSEEPSEHMTDNEARAVVRNFYDEQCG